MNWQLAQTVEREASHSTRNLHQGKATPSGEKVNGVTVGMRHDKTGLNKLPRLNTCCFMSQCARSKVGTVLHMIKPSVDWRDGKHAAVQGSQMLSVLASYYWQTRKLTAVLRKNQDQGGSFSETSRHRSSCWKTATSKLST